MPVLHLYTYLICGVISFTLAVHLNENDPQDGRGCYIKTTGEVLGFDTKVYQKCKQYLCTPDGLVETGELLAGCHAKNICYDWLLQHTVPLESILYHRCKQFKCTAEDWIQVAGMKDPRCTKKNQGCKIPGTGDLAPFGAKGYWKCEQYECTETGFAPTGNYNPGCNMSETDSYSDLEDNDTACFDHAHNKPIKIGHMMFINCNEYVCTRRDILPTGEKDPRCMM